METNYRPLDVVVKEFFADKNQDKYEELLFSFLMTAQNSQDIYLPLENGKNTDQEEFLYPRVKAADGNYYYALCTKDATLPKELGTMSAKLDTTIEIMLNDESVSGACINPWDGGIFIPSKYLIALLENN